MMSAKRLRARTRGERRAVLEYLESRPGSRRQRRAAAKLDAYLARGSVGGGVFVGALTRRLGLTRYNSDAVANLLDGRHPVTGERLVQCKFGHEHAPGFDHTFSAFKSFSSLWAAAGPALRHLLLECHTEAVDAAVRLSHMLVAARRGKGGAIRIPTEVLSVRYDHFTARPASEDRTRIDPAIHSHCLLLNVGYGVDHQFSGIDPEMFTVKFLGACYRLELARRLEAIGLAVERDEDSIRLVAPQKLHRLAAQQSRRRIEIEEELRARGLDARRATAEQRQYANLITRAEKDYRTTPEQRDEAWKVEAAEFGVDETTVAECRALAARLAAEQKPQAIDYRRVFARLTAHNSTFTKKDLLREIAIEAQTIRGMTIAAVLQEAERVAKSELVALDQTAEIYTTPEMYELEHRAVAQLCALARATSRGISTEKIATAIAEYEQQTRLNTGRSDFVLVGEQVSALQKLGGPQRLFLVDGHAGVGKSTMFAALRGAAEASGFRMIGAAPTGAAAAQLEREAGIQSTTVHRLVLELVARPGLRPRRELDGNTFVLVDEASLLDSRLGATLIAKVVASGAKLIMVGDLAQLEPIGPGAIFRDTIRRVGATAELKTVRRQEQAHERAAAKLQREGRARQAIELLAKHKQVSIADDVERAVDTTLAKWEQTFSPDDPTTIMLVPTNFSTAALNTRARERLIAAGRLSRQSVSIRVRNAKGDTKTLEFALGDRIVFLKNAFHPPVRNRQFATITRIEEVDGRIELHAKKDAGDEVVINTAAYNFFDHGYSSTIDSAQGITVDHCVCLLAGSRRSMRRRGYVALTRARKKVEVVLTRDEFEEDFSELSTLPRDHETRFERFQKSPPTIEKSIQALQTKEQKKSTLDFDPMRK